jgi:hypothetical protein
VVAPLYLHPLAALATIALAAWAAGLGLRSRRPGPRGEQARRRHARITPWLYALVLANWAGGLLALWRLRPELEATTSGHFAVGSAIVAVFTAAALVSRQIAESPWARAVHPWLGASALLLCGVQVFLGLQLLP